MRCEQLRQQAESTVAILRMAYDRQVKRFSRRVRALSLQELLARFGGDLAAAENDSGAQAQQDLNSWVAQTPRVASRAAALGLVTGGQQASRDNAVLGAAAVHVAAAAAAGGVPDKTPRSRRAAAAAAASTTPSKFKTPAPAHSSSAALMLGGVPQSAMRLTRSVARKHQGQGGEAGASAFGDLLTLPTGTTVDLDAASAHGLGLGLAAADVSHLKATSDKLARMLRMLGH
jgi:hypothetical protein